MYAARHGPVSSSALSTIAEVMSAQRSNACSISVVSDPEARIFTWPSARPRMSIGAVGQVTAHVPGAVHPGSRGPYGSGTNFSAVAAGRPW